jgi:hypothetical protein
MRGGGRGGGGCRMRGVRVPQKVNGEDEGEGTE